MHRELNSILDAAKKGSPIERAAWVSALEIFAERIADVLEVEPPDVVLAEGAPALGGDGFDTLCPGRRALPRELGGHATSPLLEVAANRFGVDLASPPIAGDGALLLGRRRPVHFVAMAGFQVHSDASPPMTWQSADKPVAHAAPIVERSLVLDGLGNDAAWSRVTPVAWETDYAGKSTGIVTRVRILYSPQALYVLWQLESAGLNVDRSRSLAMPRPKLFEEDCVELFFTPDPARPWRYYEMEQGPFGHFWDLDIDRRTGKSDTTWSSGARIATTRDPAKHTATIESAFTAPDIVKALVPGARLPIGLYRMEGTGQRAYLAWSPTRTEKPNFHVPEAFGMLVLDP